jgi:hypothetical protein
MFACEPRDFLLTESVTRLGVFLHYCLASPAATPAVIALVVPGIGILRFRLFSFLCIKTPSSSQSLLGGAALAVTANLTAKSFIYPVSLNSTEIYQAGKK